MSNLLRQWMYARLGPDGGLSEHFRLGVEDFIKFAVNNGECPNGNMIRCPCAARMCQNTQFFHVDEVELHLLSKGFVANYYQWTNHGESRLPLGSDRQVYIGSSQYQPNYGETSGRMLESDYEMGTSESYSSDMYSSEPIEYDQGIGTSSRTMIRAAAGPEFVYPTYPHEAPNPQAQGFYNMMRATEQPLYEGSMYSMFDAMSEMMSAKSDTNMSTTSYDRVAGIFKKYLPEGNTFPSNLYQTKKVMHGLGLPVEKIDACINACMIYWGVDSNRKRCKVCREPRYKDNGTTQSIMYYLPLLPRLQRLYASKATASHMRWHAEHQSDPDIMVHPSDSEAWRHFDEKHPDFAAETRNVRLGLMADGFTPFGVFGEQYSCWPIILTPYNLPPGMVMKEQFMFLTVLIPGPKDPGQMIDVFMQPLIADLKRIWTKGAETYDCSLGTNFCLRAALMWTISDFPAYSMLSGWSTSGRLACPHCMEDSDAFYLPHGRKITWFDNHRKFLPQKHRYRKNKKNFIKNRLEKGKAPTVKTGKDIIDWIDELGLMKVTRKHAMEHNEKITKADGGYGWKKRGILWNLPYWKDNLIRHNLDVMHIEKNCFENIFNTVFDVTGKSKDNLASRMDVENICERPGFTIKSNGTYDRAYYVLEKQSKESICDWIKTIKFPDGCVSNMGRCVDMRKNKLFGMKSHDCHVFMQRLIPIAFRLTLEKEVYSALVQFSTFFRRLTCTTISVSDMLKLEEEIPIILCQLEMIFPPSFFDPMEHLPIHLPYEARIAGPVHYRWMYPCERFLGKLKRSVRNKAHVEASIINAYLTEEANNFASVYFDPHVQTRRNKVQRNDDGGERPHIPGNLSIFTYPGRAAGNCVTRWLDEKEYKAARRYILTNCKEVEQYSSIFEDEMYSDGWVTNASELECCIEENFVPWFQRYAKKNIDNNDFLLSLSQGPLRQVTTYPIYFVNGYVFHTKKHGSNKSTANSGVCIKGTSDYTDQASADDYYGTLAEVVELEYPMLPIKKVVLFKCDWFNMDPSSHMHIDKKLDLVSINSKGKYQKYDPFILASQATQVCYIPYPTYNGKEPDNWWAVCKVKARSSIQISGTDGKIHKNAFQDDESSSRPITDGGKTIPGELQVPNYDPDYVLAPNEEPPLPTMCESESDEEENVFDEDILPEED